MESKKIKQKTILICQDDKSKMVDIKNFFKEKGYKVVCCTYAQEAIDNCIKSLIDILIIDFI